MTDHPKSVGSYEIRRQLGEGGMGSVYLAIDPMIGRPVAVKLIREDVTSPELRERFNREAQSAGNLNHPNIVTIYQLGDHDGQPFIVMEYVSGRTLSATIAKRTSLPLVEKLRIMEQLCSGLAYAHAAGIIHRDVKPANIILDEQGTVKILDFGVARIADSGLTQSRNIMGTLPYMSPEQYSGAGVGYRSDMFAVGSVFYELLAYRRAFPGTLEDGIMVRILNADPEPLHRFCPDLDPEIEKVVVTCLAKDPNARYKDLSAVEAQIRLIRQRLEDSELIDLPEPTVRIEGMSTVELKSTRGLASKKKTRARSRRVDREELKRRRIALVKGHVDGARRAFEVGDHEACIEAAQQALAIDDEQVEALDLLDQARTALDRGQILDWMETARKRIATGALTVAGDLVEQALGLDADSEEAAAVQREIEAAREAQRRAKIIREAMEAARAGLELGDLEGAIRHTDEVLALEPAHEKAKAFRASVQATIEEHDRRASLEQEARQVSKRARTMFAVGQRGAAFSLLTGHQPAHPITSATLEELRLEAEEIARRQREEQERREAERLHRAHKEKTQAAEEQLRRGNIEQVMALVSLVLQEEPEHAEARKLKQRVEQLAAERAAAESRVSDENESRRRVAEQRGKAEWEAPPDSEREPGMVRQSGTGPLLAPPKDTAVEPKTVWKTAGAEGVEEVVPEKETPDEDVQVTGVASSVPTVSEAREASRLRDLATTFRGSRSLQGAAAVLAAGVIVTIATLLVFPEGPRSAPGTRNPRISTAVDVRSEPAAAEPERPASRGPGADLTIVPRPDVADLEAIDTSPTDSPAGAPASELAALPFEIAVVPTARPLLEGPRVTGAVPEVVSDPDPTEALLPELRLEAGKLLAQGSLAEAAEIISRGVALAPDDPGLLSLAGDVVDASVERMASAKSAAEGQRAAGLVPDAFADATDAEQRGVNARSEGRTDDAVEAFLSATVRFEAAATRGRAISERARSKVDAREQAEAGVRQALRNFEAAYANLSVPALVSVAPYMAAETETLERSFKQAQSFTVDLRDVVIAITEDRTSARVTCTRNVSYRPKRGLANSNADSIVFDLEQRGANWVIASMESR